MKKVALLVGLVVLLLMWLRPAGFISLGPGMMAPEVPMQDDLEDADAIVLGDYSLDPRAEFSLKARVLASKRYRTGDSAKLAPYDLALGWSEMSDEEVIKQLSISQSGRYYRWSTSELPVPQDKIKYNSSNMHLIPADKSVRRAIAKARPGNLIVLVGKLVNVSGPSGFSWKTSMTRNDTGSGACEVVYVERFAVTTP